MDNYTKLSEGFTGQKSVVVPYQISRKCKDMPVVRQFYVTDVGYYPKARYHYRQRSNGSDQHILIYCVEGKGWFEENERRYEVTSNQFLIIPKSTPHKYGADRKFPWSIYWMHFDGEMAREMLSTFHQKPILRELPFLEERLHLFRKIIDTLGKGLSEEQIQFSGLLSLHLLGTLIFPGSQSGGSASAGEHRLVEMVIGFLQENVHRMITIDLIVDQFDYSSSHLFSVFKRKTGYPPIQYFNLMKIQKACEWLNFTDLNVKAISFQLGFQDPLYFSRLFKKHMGKSPMRYREDMIG